MIRRRGKNRKPNEIGTSFHRLPFADCFRKCISDCVRRQTHGGKHFWHQLREFLATKKILSKGSIEFSKIRLDHSD